MSIRGFQPPPWLWTGGGAPGRIRQSQRLARLPRVNEKSICRPLELGLLLDGLGTLLSRLEAENLLRPGSLLEVGHVVKLMFLRSTSVLPQLLPALLPVLTVDHKCSFLAGTSLTQAELRGIRKASRALRRPTLAASESSGSSLTVPLSSCKTGRSLVLCWAIQRSMPQTSAGFAAHVPSTPLRPGRLSELPYPNGERGWRRRLS